MIAKIGSSCASRCGNSVCKHATWDEISTQKLTKTHAYSIIIKYTYF